jgi:hypothetical protein
MKRKTAGIVAIIIIIVCIGYIVYDIITGRSDKKVIIEQEDRFQDINTNWDVINELRFPDGILKAVASSKDAIYCGGDTFLVCLDLEYQEQWSLNTGIPPVNALCFNNDTLYAATDDRIMLYDRYGTMLGEWGPYDDGAYITGISANRNFLAIADAGNKHVFVVDKSGALKSIIGYPGNQFIIPSFYFDVALTSFDTLLVANTGKRQIEFRTIDGTLIRAIGEEGDSFRDFCGCCNPAHFALTPEGYIVTAEKGINRIKILLTSGKLVEPVAQLGIFKASIPLDIAVGENGLIYGAYSGNSTLYTFERILIR